MVVMDVQPTATVLETAGRAAPSSAWMQRLRHLFFAVACCRQSM